MKEMKVWKTSEEMLANFKAEKDKMANTIEELMEMKRLGIVEKAKSYGKYGNMAKRMMREINPEYLLQLRLETNEDIFFENLEERIANFRNPELNKVAKLNTEDTMGNIRRIREREAELEEIIMEEYIMPAISTEPANWRI